jgi:chromate transporter
VPSAAVRVLDLACVDALVDDLGRKPCACATARCTLAGMPSLRAIASVFARYANTTFGGGSATIAVLREQIVEKRPWLDREQFDLAYALSRLTPGTNLLAFCTAAGWITRRGLGALFALLAASLPCSLLAVAMTAGYDALATNAYFHAALRGALAAAVAIMVATAWVFAEPHVRAAPLKAIVIPPCAIALSLGVHLSPVHVLLAAAVVGLAWPAKDEP